MTRKPTTPDELKQIELGLSAFSKRIDGVLRKHYANSALKKFMEPAKENRHLPFWVSLFAGFIVFIFAHNHLPLPMITWLALIPAVLVALLVGQVLSVMSVKAYFADYRFQLMRHEQYLEGEEFPDQFIFSCAPEQPTGFGYSNWREVQGVLSGHMLISISNVDSTNSAFIHLRVEGHRLGLSSRRGHFYRYKDNALAPLPEEIRLLAHEFDQACDRHIQVVRRIEDARALRSKKDKPKPRDLEQIWKSVTIAPEVKTKLISLSKHFAEGSAAASRGLLLYGPPGTGKTLIARALADSMGCEFIPLSLPDLKAGYIGQSGGKVKALWQRALAQPRAVLFIDECEGVFCRRGGVKGDNFSEEIVQAFLAEWDGFTKQTTVWVVGATNRRDLIDPAILSRFGEEIEIGLPGEAQRVEILSHELKRKGVSKQLPPAAGELTQGMSGRDLEALAGRLAREQSGSEIITDAILSDYTQTFRKQGSTKTDQNAVWENLVLSEPILKELKTMARMLKDAESFTQRGFSVPSGLLLYGPPGTGKTEIARTLANETGLRFIAATTADMKGGFTGQSGQKVQELFERAREAAPSILFLDELDIVAQKRGSGNSGDAFTQEIIGQLLQEMNGVKAYSQIVFVLAASNCIDKIDDAVLSRFQKKIEIPIPDMDGRKRLLQSMLRSKPVAFDMEETSELLAGRGEGLSGRDLRNWIERAEQNAVGRAIDAENPKLATLKLVDFIHIELPKLSDNPTKHEIDNLLDAYLKQINPMNKEAGLKQPLDLTPRNSVNQTTATEKPHHNQGAAGYKGVTPKMDDQLKQEITTPHASATSQHPCPECGKAMRRIPGKYSDFFWGCSGYPDCTMTLPDDNGKPGQRKSDEASTFACPKCGKPLLHRVKKGNGGYDFWGCSDFKNGCKTTYKDLDGAPLLTVSA